MMPAANKKMVLFEFTMISVANNGLLPTVSAKKTLCFGQNRLCFCTLRVCYEDNLRNALKSSKCEAEEGNNCSV
jgi:hypothetical protein